MCRTTVPTIFLVLVFRQSNHKSLSLLQSFFHLESLDERYYSSHRVTSNQQVPTNTEKTIIFNQNYEGANFLYKNDTGTLAPLDGRVYLLNAEVGLKGMVAGDEVEIFLFVNGVKLKKNQ